MRHRACDRNCESIRAVVAVVAIAAREHLEPVRCGALGRGQRNPPVAPASAPAFDTSSAGPARPESAEATSKKMVMKKGLRTVEYG
ncbi:hypothetical protein WS70_23390 [Burkholderia mayonis]|uniref:Uncharacterized protein n=1 Tax=Burkholderia mayonis TaxID=1385591 RepID=A0A1B4FM31_9BURK|nr:hypothetical protein WS70_23390 [Burkholderia mayonis]